MNVGSKKIMFGSCIATISGILILLYGLAYGIFSYILYGIMVFSSMIGLSIISISKYFIRSCRLNCRCHDITGAICGPCRDFGCGKK